MSRKDTNCHETALINRSKRQLADGVDKDPLEKLRLLCFSRGARGIVGLSRRFRIMDNDGNKNLDFGEFRKGICESGLDCNEMEVRDLFNRFDTDNSGSINVTEFIAKLRPPLNSGRQEIIDKAFKKLDRNGDGMITVEDFRKVYNVKDHPMYISGEQSENEILTQFLHHFEGPNGNRDGKVTKEEFDNCYSTISASIDNDTYFDLMMRRAYKL